MEETLLRFMETHGGGIPYAVVFVCSFLEYTFPPFPSDTVLLFAGVLAGKGALDPWIVFGLTVFGSLLGALFLYELGLKKGRPFFMKRDYPFFPRERIATLERWFRRHGGKILIVNRFFSGFRAAFFVAAGLGQMPRGRVLFFGALGSAIWTGIVLEAGYLVGSNWSSLTSYLGLYSTVVVAVVLLLFLGAGVRAWRRRARARDKTPT